MSEVINGIRHIVLLSESWNSILKKKICVESDVVFVIV